MNLIRLIDFNSKTGEYEFEVQNGSRTSDAEVSIYRIKKKDRKNFRSYSQPKSARSKRR